MNKFKLILNRYILPIASRITAVLFVGTVIFCVLALIFGWDF